MKIQITYSLTRNAILSSLFVLLFGLGCNDNSPAPVPVPTKFGSLIGNDQEAPARATLPNPILLIFTEAKGIENTDMVLLDFTIIKGNGKASKTKDTVELAKTLKSNILWTLGDFGDQQMIISGKWKSSNANVDGFPIIVNAKTSVVKDEDDNAYNTVQIGEQVWLAENLKTTKYNDGTNITNLNDDSAWVQANHVKSAGYCWYNKDKSNKKDYGALYNFYTIATNKVCPSGWHVPSETETEKLITFAGGNTAAGKALKEAGESHWAAPNSGTNELLFTALPAGIRYDTWPSYNSMGIDGGFWTSTLKNSDEAWEYVFDAFVDDAIKESKTLGFGVPVRCLKD